MRFTLLLIAILLVGCTEVDISSTAPDINITHTTPGTEPEPAPPPGQSGTISLSPASVTVAVGANANVTVTVRDAGGQEVPVENLSVNIADSSVLGLVEIDGRILQFTGVSAGTTSVIISVTGLQTSFIATVIS